MVVKKIIKDAAKEAAKKARAAQRKRAKANQNKPSSNSQSGQPEPGTVGARKTTKAKPTGVRKKAKPTGVRKKAAPTGVTKAKPTKGKVNPRAGLKKIPTTKVSPGMKAAISAPAVGLAALAVTQKGKRKPVSSEASIVSFGSAFKEARKKGEGTKFTWNGKSYTAVTKDDLKKKGYDGNELRQYANNKGKARRPIKRIGQGIKKVLLGKDKKFGGDKGLIDFIRGPRSKAKAKAKQGPANKKQTVKVNLRGGGMATGVSRSKVTPGQKSAIFRGRPDMPNVMPDRTRGGVLDTAELAGKRKPGMKKGGIAAKKMRYGGETRPMGSDPKPMIPERPRPMPQESRVRVRPGMKAGGAVKKYKAGGLAKRGLGKAYMKSKR